MAVIESRNGIVVARRAVTLIYPPVSVLEEVKRSNEQKVVHTQKSPTTVYRAEAVLVFFCPAQTTATST